MTAEHGQGLELLSRRRLLVALDELVQTHIREAHFDTARTVMGIKDLIAAFPPEELLSAQDVAERKGVILISIVFSSRELYPV